MSPDVFIVGGGPAGLATAIAARRKGLSVTVADGIVPPADKACGEGLLPDTLAALADIGVQIPASDSFAFRGIRFLDGDAVLAADFPGRHGRGMRRTTLHRVLVEHAEAAGVRLQWGRHVDFDRIRAAWIIGADGENSLMRRWAGLDERLRDKPRFGFRRHYRIRPWSDYMELYWGNACQVYVTPVSGDGVCVAAISRSSQLRLDDALCGFPGLAERLRAAPVLSADRGAPSFTRRLKSVYRNNVALVGDASGSVDAITGEGLSLAFRQAAALANALSAGDLSGYQREHRVIARRPEWMSRLLLALGDHRLIRRAAIRSMSAVPDVFSMFLALHVGGKHDEVDTAGSADDYAGAFRPGNDTGTRRRADAR